jgi:hypothetical protein
MSEARQHIRVISHISGRRGSRGGGRGRARADKITAWLDSQDDKTLWQLVMLLRHGSETEVGDWLEAHACPRSWRKQMRVS